MQTNESTEAIIRKTGKNDSYVYNHEVRTFKDGQRITTRRQISGREYIEMLDQRKPGYRELKKFKQCFIYNNQYCYVETVINADSQPSFLRFETTNDSAKLQLPDFLNVLREVTTEDIYASSSIAKIGWKMPDDDKRQITTKLAQPLPTQRVASGKPEKRSSPPIAEKPSKTTEIIKSPTLSPERAAKTLAS